MRGKTLRMRRISQEGLFVVIPLDHGVSVGPIEGIKDPTATIRQADQGHATGIIVHKGLVKNYIDAHARAGLLVHLSASTDRGPDPNDKRLVAGVEEAIGLGADAVSVHINVGSDTEARQLEELGRVVAEAGRVGLPVLAMMYPRGPRVKDPYEPRIVAHAARLADELGADVVKTLYTGDVKSFRDVTSSVGIPVLVAGGAKMETESACLQLVHDAMRAGAAGISIGRNVFQARDPRRMTEALARLVLEGDTVKDAQRHLKEVRS